MATSAISDQVRGKTFRFTCTGGVPQEFEMDYDFDEDGVVKWNEPARSEVKPKKGSKTRGAKRAPAKSVVVANTAHYMAADAGKHVCLVSYRAQSGFALTAVLNRRTGKFTGVASNTEMWLAVSGTFEAVG
jgi:hypothetical protein